MEDGVNWEMGIAAYAVLHMKEMTNEGLPQRAAKYVVLCGDLNGKEIQRRADACAYIWPIHFAVQQKLTQQYKATKLQLKK